MPPAPGMMPRRVSGRAKRAVGAARRKVVDRASSSPPPSAREDIPAMVGMGSVERVVRRLRRVVRKWVVLWRRGGV